jgi:hypothetical protein
VYKIIFGTASLSIQMYETKKKNAKVCQTYFLIKFNGNREGDGENECGWVNEGAVLAFLGIL